MVSDYDLNQNNIVYISNIFFRKKFTRNYRYFNFLFELPSLNNVFNLLLFIAKFQPRYCWKDVLKKCIP